MSIPKGRYVLVRSRDQGVMCGSYAGHSGREVRLTGARQLYSWEGGRLTLLDVAIKPVGTVTISGTMPDEQEVYMLEACAIIPVTPAVEKYLREAPEWQPASA